MQKLLPLLLLLISIRVSAQSVFGTVEDDEGNRLPFASVSVKGTGKGVTANQKGVFQLNMPPGKHILDCRFVGYVSMEKTISVGDTDSIRFVLRPQKLTLKEVVIKRGEDPALEIIKNAIRKRPFYHDQVEQYSAQIYVKGLVKLRELPERFLGKSIPEADKSAMGIDSSGKGIIYLSESVSHVYSQKPNKFKLEVEASRVSGSNEIGFDFPVFISFYENNVNVFGGALAKRGFVSPIADGALHYYNYKYLGSFMEDGVLVNTIEVKPRRSYEPLFSGEISITEGDWRIYSCNLLLTKSSQLEILDTIQISQIHMPVTDEVWRIKNQVLHFAFDIFGFNAVGNFVNVYSNYNLEPDFGKNFFNNIVVKYDTAVNKKTLEYWKENRAVPLEPEEFRDYRKKDSLLQERMKAPPPDKDSLRKRQGPVTISQIVLSGITRNHFDSLHPFRIDIAPLSQSVEYNTVEGIAVNPSIVFSKYVKRLDSRFSLLTDFRYGFSNGHFDPWAGVVINSNDSFKLNKERKRLSAFLAGGKRVSEFFKDSDIDPLGNTIGTLLYGRNERKLYENNFVKGGFSKQWPGSLKITLEARYEDRLPLENTTLSIWNKKWEKRLTPNYPVEILSHQFQRHQAVAVHFGVSFRPGQKYIQFPSSKIAIGSRFPFLYFDYTKGINGIAGSDVNYDKWELKVADHINMKIAGSLDYNFKLGGFLNDNAVYAQDYKHFYNNISTIAAQYVKSFQNLPHYRYSTTSPFYTELHLEHHANGLLTNKIPLFKKLNWYLVEGTNLLYINENEKYAEVFVGLENIFKIFRADVVFGFQPGVKPTTAFRIGFGGLLGDTFNQLRFKRYNKIVDKW